MTVAWRLVKSRRAADALTGEGARLFGGRWNLPGTRLVYLADSLALAALETLVHLAPAHRGIRFVAIRAELPDDLVDTLPARDLPAAWRAEPALDDTRRIGTRWAAAGTSAALRVPSVVVPVESNVLVNPVHPRWGEARWSAPVPFGFDPRLWS